MIRRLSSALAMAVVAALVGCADAAVPSEEIDRLTLAFLNAKIYAGGAVVCESKQIADRDYVGCHNQSLGGRSNTSLWLYEDKAFKAVNGTARTFAERQFSGIPNIGTVPLPMPSDIKVGEVLAHFEK